MTKREEGMVTWFFMFVALMSVLFLASTTQDFEEKCSSACSPERFITPLYQMQHTCFCDVGHGKWLRKNIK